MGRLRNGSRFVTKDEEQYYIKVDEYLRLVQNEGSDITCFYSSNELLDLKLELIEENTTDDIENSLDHIFGDIKGKINELEQEINKIKKYKS